MNGRTMRLAAAVAVVALQLQPRMVAIAAAPCSVNFADDEDFVHTKLVVPAPDSSEAPPLARPGSRGYQAPPLSGGRAQHVPLARVSSG